MKFCFEPALKFSAALALAFAFAPPCSGRQGNMGPRRTPTGSSTQRELQRTLERDLLFKEMRDMARRGPAPAQPARRPAFTQISEDFARIQIANNELARALAAGEELDPMFVARAASEIRKRAGRLKSNLALPESDEPGPKEKAELEPSQLKAALNTLDGLVVSFVSNPGFQSVKVIDAQWAVKARQDLEEIIELSGRVKACGEQLRKAARKSR